MTDLVWDFEVDGGNFELAGSASQTTKSRLKQLGLPNETVRKVIIAMYEGEINMVIHADGGSGHRDGGTEGNQGRSQRYGQGDREHSFGNEGGLFHRIERNP